MIGLIGKKVGMTQVFDESGSLVPITAVKIEPNEVVGERTEKKNGYSAVVLGIFQIKKKHLKKPLAGQFPKGTEPKRMLVEFRDFERECKIGEKLGTEIFEGIRYVDVVGRSKGKGYQGVIRRHGFRGGKKTHGSKFHRANGSTGMAASPSKVLKGTKMAGRMGNVSRTAQNLNLVGIDKERSLLLIKGSIPGSRDGVVLVRKALKK
jgi:large subunit ribosomal protein L3